MDSLMHKRICQHDVEDRNEILEREKKKKKKSANVMQHLRGEGRERESFTGGKTKRTI